MTVLRSTRSASASGQQQVGKAEIFERRAMPWQGRDHLFQKRHGIPGLARDRGGSCRADTVLRGCAESVAIPARRAIALLRCLPAAALLGLLEFADGER